MRVMRGGKVSSVYDLKWPLPDVCHSFCSIYSPDKVMKGRCRLALHFQPWVASHLMPPPDPLNAGSFAFQIVPVTSWAPAVTCHVTMKQGAASAWPTWWEISVMHAQGITGKLPAAWAASPATAILRILLAFSVTRY